MNENETNVVEQPASIPFYVHEGEINRLERINKRFFILLLIVFFALVGTNAYWIWYESRYEDVVVTQDECPPRQHGSLFRGTWIFPHRAG